MLIHKIKTNWGIESFAQYGNYDLLTMYCTSITTSYCFALKRGFPVYAGLIFYIDAGARSINITDEVHGQVLNVDT